MKRLGLSEIQKTEFEIMSAVIDFLNENSILYYVCGGTALGSVRHQGFIPWDDDIDIFLPRKDYNRLLELTDGILLDGYISIKRPGDSNYIYPFAKACSEKTVVYEQNVSDKKYSIGIFIDIFPLDNYYNCAFANVLFWTKSRLLHSMLESATNQINLSAPGSFRYRAKNTLRAIQKPIAKRVSPEYLTKKIDNLAKKRQNKNSGYVGNIVWSFSLKVFKKSIFGDPAKGVFEGKEVNIPTLWKEYLTQMYGDDYMTLPPENKRVSHCVDAYLKNE